jgi:Macrocin-O-methyltransferase (TylF)
MAGNFSAKLRKLVNGRTEAPAMTPPPPPPLENTALKEWAASEDYGVPQRYRDNFHRYVDRGGAVFPSELIEGFTSGNRGNEGDMARFHFFCLVFDQILKEGIEGDVAELGVYKGNTATLLAAIARRTNTTAWLLDTYEGFAASDLEGVDANKRMEFADTSLEGVKALVGESHVKFVQGYFPGTASQLPEDGRYSLVHIDCDLYAPFKSAMDYFYPRLAPGGFLIMHDYSSLHWDGAEQAVDEFFLDKPESVVPVPDSAGTVVIRKSRLGDRIHNWRVQGSSDGFAMQWLNATDRGFGDHLGAGWSGLEDWGVWGIGESHVLKMNLAAPPSGDLLVEADVVAVLIGERETQTIDVVLGQDIVATWHFSKEDNRAVRQFRVPLAHVANEAGFPVVTVAFRPKSWQSPAELDPEVPDTRAIGMGLYKLRYRVAFAKAVAQVDEAATSES